MKRNIDILFPSHAMDAPEDEPHEEMIGELTEAEHEFMFTEPFQDDEFQ